MWKLLLNLLFIVVSISSMASDSQWMDYFHEVRGTSNVIAFVNQTNCTGKNFCYGESDISDCQYRCERRLILDLKRFSVIEAHAFQPNGFTELALRSYEKGNCSRKLISLTPESFYGMSYIKNLWLDCTEFPSTPNLFKYFISLEVLIISRMDFINLHDHFFSDFPKLRKLTLKKVTITSITNDTFSNISPNLECLNLISNDLTVVEGQSFQKFHNLVNITIQKNHLTDLPLDMFDGLYALQGINLGYNQITALRGKTFSHLSQLQHLILSKNRISKIEFETFSDLSLHSLDLSYNELEVLPVGVFKNLSNLEVFSLSGNKISTVGNSVFENLGPQTDLDLAHNNINHIEPLAFHGLHLRNLRLRKNNLNVLQLDTFNGLILAEALNLCSNNITDIKKGAFRNLTSDMIIWERHNITEIQKVEWGVDSVAKIRNSC